MVTCICWWTECLQRSLTTKCGECHKSLYTKIHPWDIFILGRRQSQDEGGVRRLPGGHSGYPCPLCRGEKSNHLNFKTTGLWWMALINQNLMPHCLRLRAPVYDEFFLWPTTIFFCVCFFNAKTKCSILLHPKTIVEGCLYLKGNGLLWSDSVMGYYGARA